MCKGLTDFPEVVICLSIPCVEMGTFWLPDRHPHTLNYKLPQAVKQAFVKLTVTISTNEPQWYNCDLSYLGTPQTDVLAFFPDLFSRKIFQEYPCPPPNKCSLYLNECMFVFKKIMNIKNYSCLNIFPQSYYSHTVDFFFYILKAKYFISNRKFIMTCIMTPPTTLDRKFMYCWVGACWPLPNSLLWPPGLKSGSQPSQMGVWPSTCCVPLLRPWLALEGLVRSSATPHKHLHGAGGWTCWWVKAHCCLWSEGLLEVGRLEWAAEAGISPCPLQARGISLKTVFYHCFGRFMDQLCPQLSWPWAQGAYLYVEVGTPVFWSPSPCWSFHPLTIPQQPQQPGGGCQGERWALLRGVPQKTEGQLTWTEAGEI